MATMAIATGMMAGQAASSSRAVRGRAETLAERNRRLYDEQRKARRGPALEVFFAKHIDNSRIVKANDPERQREMRSFTMAMSVLFMLVMVYVWQHFTAIEVGYHVESQKVQVEQLREQNRELRLSEAQLTDPGRIDRMAKQLGLDAPEPGQVVRPDGSDGSAPVMAQASAPTVPTY
ncbi:FtsB/FtsL family cell division protein [Granulicella arctica]|uniref:cell division protein FtsL n=1 Tax=Granulicella arctica TaxID=940613 RepID=UPI0021DFE51E|nr:cell division protein FtsL [Granulicella arctica]